MSDRINPTRLLQARPGAADRLDSWKEIAAYLGREQRTVQRWERSEGLPVHRLHHGKSGSVYALRSELDAWMGQRSHEPPELGRAKPRRRQLRLAAIVLFGILAVATALVLYRTPRPLIATPVPFTSDPGSELEPRLSPEATRVAYVWNGEAEDNFDIYVRMLAGGAPLRLTINAASDYSPAWSPDGAVIAFLRRTGAAAAGVFVIPALGGAERRIAEVRTANWLQWGRPGPFLTWSPDGKWLVTAGSQGDSWGDVLLRVAPATGEIQALTSLPAKAMGDMAPAFSPDGRTLAFSRLLSWGRSDLCLLPVSQDLRPLGDVRTLKTGSAWSASPVWLPDGRGIVFSTGSMDAPRLARISSAGAKEAERLPGAGDYAWMPTLARSADGSTRLVYTQHFESVNLWRSSLQDGGAPVRLIASAHWSYEPSWSPAADRIAFLSDRTGYGEVWVADADGRHPQQWTFLKQARLGGPRWSPDGRSIAFTAPGARGSSVYRIDAPGAAPVEVRGSEQCGYLDWAHDGSEIYFSSNRAPQGHIWRIRPHGGEAQRVTETAARVPALSSDGRSLYYLRLAGPDGRNDLWRAPLAGGAEERVLEFVDAYSLGDTGIAFKYYRPGPQPEGPDLRFLRFASGKVERLPVPQRPLRYGIALSRDGRYLLHAQADYEVSDLMLVDPFR